MSFQIVRNDITKVKADAIVNTANPKPTFGGGTDSAIYKSDARKIARAASRSLYGVDGYLGPQIHDEKQVFIMSIIMFISIKIKHTFGFYLNKR